MIVLLLLTSPPPTWRVVRGGSAAGPFHSRHETHARLSRAPAEPMIAGTLAGRQPAPGFGLLLHRPEHARRLRGALLRVARVALVAIDRGVVIADQTVHQLGIVHVAARHARGVHKPAAGIDAHVRLHAEVPLCGSRLPASFLVDGEAAINVASTIVPPRSNAPRASRCSATALNTVFVSSCASSRCRKFKIVVSSGTGSRRSSRLQNARW